MCFRTFGCFNILLVLFIIIAVPVSAQQAGHPFLRHFSPQDYGAHIQVSDVLQLPYPDGRIIFATGTGIVVYDGERFSMVRGTPLMVTRLHHSDRFGLFYGSPERFGFLSRDPFDRLVYNNLSEQIDSLDRSFGFLNEIHDFHDKVILTTPEKIITYNGEFAETISSPAGAMYLSFIVDDRYYVGERGTGLLSLETNGSLELVPGGDFFASSDRVPVFMLPYDENRILTGTVRDGLYLYSKFDSGAEQGGIVERFSSEIQQRLTSSIALVHGLKLRDGNYAVATSEPAVHIFNQQGKVVQTINSRSGMINESINRLYEDLQGNLWIATNNGIVVAEVNHPVSRYGEADGIQGIILKSLYHRGELYVATSVGVFRKIGNQFQPVSGITGLTWDIESWEHPERDDIGYVMIANQFGLYTFDGNVVRQVLDNYASAVKASDVFPDRVYVGGANFTTMVEWRNGSFVQRGGLIPTGNPVRGILEDNDGMVWLATQSNGMRKLTPEYSMETMKIYLNEGDYDVSGNSMMQWIEGRLVVSTMFNYYAYEPTSDTFVDFRIDGLSEEDHAGIYFHLFEGDRYWIGSSLMRPHIVQFSGLPSSDPALKVEAPFRAIPPVVSLHMQLYRDTLWISNPEGLFKVDLNRPIIHETDFIVSIRDFTVISDTTYQLELNTSDAIRIGFSPSRYRFYVSAPWFGSSDQLEYRFRMDGLGEQWTEWSGHPEIEYTALREGSYSLQVEARNREGQIANTSLVFEITPPWHRSWWMYLMLLVIGTGLVFWVMQTVSRVRVRKLEAFNRELEEQVRIRSEELSQRNEALRIMNEEKNDFMNIAAHDLRNPLTGIQGMASIMVDAQSDIQSGVVRSYGTLIHNSARQMFDIIDGYLNVHKIEQGEMYPEFTEFDLGQYVSEIQPRYAVQLSTKSMKCVLDTHPVMVRADISFTSQILDNLVSNAIKYSPPGTKITVTVDQMDEYAYFKISDQGPGIPDDKKSELYKKFSKIGNKPTGGESSVGLGLSIVKQLIEKMGGRIECDSVMGQGTTFTVYFPLISP